MPIDQTHEQNNAIVKGSDGAVGLTQIHQLSENGSLLGLNKHGFLWNLKNQYFFQNEEEIYTKSHILL